MADNVSLITPEAETSDEMENMYLNFNVGGEVYGIEVRYILQIVGMQEITEMPEMTPYMKGFINLRGTVIPVVSMRLRFSKPDDSVLTDRACIVVVRVGEKDIGLIVDAIQETITIDPEYISPPPTTDMSIDRTFVSGIARLPGERISILVNVLKLFDSQF